MEENMENDVLGFDTDTSIKDDDNTSINVLKESDNSVSNNSAVNNTCLLYTSPSPRDS